MSSKIDLDLESQLAEAVHFYEKSLAFQKNIQDDLDASRATAAKLREALEVLRVMPGVEHIDAREHPEKDCPLCVVMNALAGADPAPKEEEDDGDPCVCGHPDIAHRDNATRCLRVGCGCALFRPATPPPEPHPQTAVPAEKKMDWEKFQRVGKELFGDIPEEEITRLLDHEKPEDIMRKAGWLSPAERAQLVSENELFKGRVKVLEAQNSNLATMLERTRLDLRREVEGRVNRMPPDPREKK